MNVKTIYTLGLVLLMTVAAYGQPDHLISEVSSSSENLTTRQSEKFNKIRNKEIYKSASLIRFGSLKAFQNRGALPVAIPGRNGKLVAHTDSVEFLSDDHYTWHGTFKKDKGRMLLMAREGRVFGYIRLDDASYEIQSIDDQVSVLVELDYDKLSEFSCGTSDDPAEDAGKSNVVEDKHSAEPQQKINSGYANVRVLVLYTSAANNVTGNMNDVVTLAMKQLNDAKYNSVVNNFKLYQRNL